MDVENDHYRLEIAPLQNVLAVMFRNKAQDVVVAVWDRRDSMSYRR